jgi:magnesium transporter
MIVNCVAYDHGQKLSDIPLTDVRSHLARRDCFVWVALKDPEPAELAT